MDEIGFIKERIAGYFVWLHGAEAMERLRAELDNDVDFYSSTRRAFRLCLMKRYTEGTLIHLVQKDFGHAAMSGSDEDARLWLKQMFGLLFAAPTTMVQSVSGPSAEPDLAGSPSDSEYPSLT